MSESGSASGATLAVAGATGLVGNAILENLAASGYDAAEIIALASEESVGKRVDFGSSGVWVDGLADFDFSTVPLVIFALPPDVAALYVPIAIAAGCRVIDHSPFVASGETRLVHPLKSGEIPEDAVIALPHSVTSLVYSLVQPWFERSFVQRILVNATLPASIDGRSGMHSLASQTVELLGGKPLPKEGVLQVAFNLVGDEGEIHDGLSPGEVRIRDELRLLMDDDLLPVDVVLQRAPVFFGISLYVEIEIADYVSADDLVEMYGSLSGVLISGAGSNWSLIDALSKNQIVLERLAVDDEDGRRIRLRATADNIRCGGAQNSVTLANLSLKRFQYSTVT